MNIDAFKAECENWDGSSSSFARTIRLALEESLTSPEELANEFQVAPATVVRWSQGVTVPLPAMQKRVVKVIHQELIK